MADSEAPAKAIQVKLVLLGGLDDVVKGNEAAAREGALPDTKDPLSEINKGREAKRSAGVRKNDPTPFTAETLRHEEDKVIKFEIWDTAGQERFHSLAPMYYRNAAAAVVVYDITKASSLEKAKAWVNELQRQANPNIVIALVGNKLDLITDGAATGSAPAPEPESAADEAGDATKDGDSASADDDAADEPETKVTPTASAPASGESLRQVTREEAEAYAKEAGGLLFFEASAKTGKGVQELFTEIAKNLPIESMMPKTAGAGGAAAGGAGNRRAAAAQSGNAGPGNKVNLNDGAANKARGGCC
ncbi:hypothetical protein QFC20_003923 [Naganishia adeliensis]|uniref:Uncharacterized protein n=1 Tax=Naganishia adeliensis TaxID=92952 RepID=A0ACC2W579_9TREE|nr:hypothetical protein QFC20_003923 [Naganishia adeliensis]